MSKSQPFSVRLSPHTDEQVTREARRVRRSKGAVLEALVDEALRTRRFPGVAFRGSDWNRRPWIIGTGLDVWEIVAASRRFATPQEMAADHDLSERQIRLARAYHEEFREDVDDAIRESETPLAQLQREADALGCARQLLDPLEPSVREGERLVGLQGPPRAHPGPRVAAQPAARSEHGDGQPHGGGEQERAPEDEADGR